MNDFWRKLARLTDPLTQLTQRKERTPVNRFRNEQVSITIANKEIQDIIRKYF